MVKTLELVDISCYIFYNYKHNAMRLFIKKEDENMTKISTDSKGNKIVVIDSIKFSDIKKRNEQPAWMLNRTRHKPHFLCSSIV